jgi:hypothetical protein
VAGFEGDVGSGAFVLETDVAVCARGEEQLDQLGVPVLGGLVKRHEPPVLGCVHLCASLDQQAADIEVPPGGGAVERPGAQAVARDGLNVRSRLDQRLGHVDATEERRVVERREPVRGPGPCETGVAGEVRSDEVGSTGDGRLEEVEVGAAGGEQPIESRPLEPVAGLDDWRQAFGIPRARQTRVGGQQAVDGIEIVRADRGEKLLHVSHGVSIVVAGPRRYPLIAAPIAVLGASTIRRTRGG